MANLTYSSFVCLLLVGAFGIARADWKSGSDLQTEIKSQFWAKKALRDSNSEPYDANHPIEIILSDNYLVTSRLEFGFTGSYDAFDRSNQMPWENFVIKSVGSGAGRIVPGFRVPAKVEAVWKWQRVTDTGGFTAIYARLPGNAKLSGGSSKVFYVNLVDDGEDFLTDEFNAKLYYPGLWERHWVDATGAPSNWKFIDAHGTNWSSFTKAQPLSVAIGDQQLRFASADDYTVSTGRITFQYGFDGSTFDGSNKTAIRWDDVDDTDEVASFTGASLPYSRKSVVTDKQLPATLPSGAPARSTLTTINESPVRCTLFAGQDYDSVEVGVESIEAVSGSPRKLKVNLNANPWEIGASQLPGINSLGYKQRFRVWNAPELLDQPGEMYLDTQNRKLYFIPFNEPPPDAGDRASLSMDVDADAISGTNQQLYVGLTQTSGSEPLENSEFWAPPLAFTRTKNFRLEDLFIRTATNEGIRMNACEGAVVRNCKFQATGHLALSIMNEFKVGAYLFKGGTVTVDDCHFRQSYHGALLIDSGAEEGKYPLDFVRRASSNIVVKNCVFEDGSLLYPSSPAVSLAHHPVGVTIGGPGVGNTFQYLPGIAIGYTGTMHLIQGNVFNYCAQYISDFGAIYSGRSWVDVGNTIKENAFSNIRRYSHPTGKPTFGEDVSAIMLDDLLCGQNITGNTFAQCDTVLVSNGGRYNALTSGENDFTNVDAIVRAAFAYGDSATMTKQVGSMMAQTKAFRAALTEAVTGTNYTGPGNLLHAEEGADREQYYLGLWNTAQTGGSYPDNWGTRLPDLSRLIQGSTRSQWSAMPESDYLGKLIAAGYVAMGGSSSTWFGDFDDRFRLKNPGSGSVYFFVNEGNRIGAFLQTTSNGVWTPGERPTKFKLNTIASTAGGGEAVKRWRPFYYGYEGFGPIDSEK